MSAYSAHRTRYEEDHASGGEPAGVALTFDDGPDPVWTPRILAALEAARARATFFVVAPLARRYPGLVRAALGNGHRVELHCTRHVRHTEMSHREIESDARAGLAELAKLAPAPELWRPPWGVCSPGTYEVAAATGLRLALWTEDTHDWRGDGAEEMLGSIEGSIGPGSVILMHDGLGPGARRAGCKETVSLVGLLSERVRRLGCEPEAMTASHARGVPA